MVSLFLYTGKYKVIFIYIHIINSLGLIFNKKIELFFKYQFIILYKRIY